MCVEQGSFCCAVCHCTLLKQFTLPADCAFSLNKLQYILRTVVTVLIGPLLFVASLDASGTD